ncbi:hypothetical protein [Deinococcus enclensis]|uniref:T6SS immunity protein Tdi1 C-terminal domain-containing protein n=1 Tax=Deinococcus enclensis TaxID=1049582 RepID=A0ABT9MBB5_9DEIO|nr:hypothetical protein [Deinococcus enclensis]MDP9763559.1 hypothetical protein [Deinococcus enclensis]
MDRIEETIELFLEEFRPPSQRMEIASEDLQGLHEHWQTFLSEVGVCQRHDGYLWIINPADFTWVTPLFDLDVVPVARDSFGNFFCTNPQGHLYSFLPHNRQLDLMAEDVLSAIGFLGEKEFTDDEELLRLHNKYVKGGRNTGYDTCYCLKPAIPLGGAFGGSEVHIGQLRDYLEMLALATR